MGVSPSERLTCPPRAHTLRPPWSDCPFPRPGLCETAPDQRNETCAGKHHLWQLFENKEERTGVTPIEKINECAKKAFTFIYENNKAIGCVYPYYKNTVGIYASAYLPIKLRLNYGCETG